VHIDRVVLDGVPLASEQVDPFHHELQEALQALLGASDARRLSTRGSVARLNAPVVSLAGGITSARLGRQVAKAIASGIRAHSSGPHGSADGASSAVTRRTP
jgi:hypothetical protein